MLGDLVTPIGTFAFDDALESDARVIIRDVETVENLGPNSTYAWSLDQEEAILAAANDVGAEATLIAPGGWQIKPGRLLAAVGVALGERARAMKRNGRRIVR
jgi:hypothetical protein